MDPTTIKVLDSHSAGEPTRLVLEGGPDLGGGTLRERVACFREKFDRYRSAIINEPRGSSAMVGALLCRPHRPDCQFAVIYFNNVGYLGMCGHGTIGVMASLAHLGLISVGKTRIETPAGMVGAELHANGDISLENVPSYRKAKDVRVEVPEVGSFLGDVAWGGNWFYLVDNSVVTINLENVQLLTNLASSIRQALNAGRYPEVDHIELFGSSPSGADSRNFVLCPGRAYDRSPCGTGTSAKLACLAADGKLPEGQLWVQESVIGSAFCAHYHWLDSAKGEIVPTITGRAYITAESNFYLQANDPFRWGIRQEP